MSRRTARRSMAGWLGDDLVPHMLGVFAWLAYLQGRAGDAGRVEGAARAQVDRIGAANLPMFDRARANLERVLAGPAAPPGDRGR